MIIIALPANFLHCAARHISALVLVKMAKELTKLAQMLGYAEKASPLRRTVTIDEIGNTAAFLCSDLASGITGETTFVDAGANIMGMVFDED